MKSIRKCLSESRSLGEFVSESMINEGLKDIINVLKTKFKQVVNLACGLVARIGDYFASVANDGSILPVNAPVNLGVAYKTGAVDRSNTLVVLPKEEAKLAGINTKIDQAYDLYGRDNSIKYWSEFIRESKDSNVYDDSILNEDYIDGKANYIKDFINTYKDNTVNEVKLAAEDPEARYNRVVDDDELREEIKLHLMPGMPSLLIWGAPGIGKTAILADIVNEIKATSNKDYRCIVKTLSNETPDNFMLPAYTDDVEQMSDEDFLDLQQQLSDPDLRANLKNKMKTYGRKAIDIPKTWLPVYLPTGNSTLDRELDKRCGNGLLFIDELSRATSQVLNVILPLINERNINGYRLGSGWSIITASNRMEDEFSGQTNLGSALKNRFAHVYYEPTVHTWRKWADKQGFISPLILNWLSLPGSENIAGGKFYYWDPEDDGYIGDKNTALMCTPRAWTNAMRTLACFSHTGNLEGFTITQIPENIIKKVLNKYVPATAIDSFISFLSVVKSIGTNFDKEVENIWKTGKSKISLDKKKIGLLSIALSQLIISSHKDKLPTTEEFINLANFLVNTDSDQLASCSLDVFKNVFFGDITVKEVDSGSNSIKLVPIRGNANYLDMLFVAKASVSKRPEHRAMIEELISQIGYNSIEDFPDYLPGIRIIASKFRNMFKNAIVGDHEALG